MSRITIETFRSETENVTFTKFPNGERLIQVFTTEAKEVADKVYEMLEMLLKDPEDDYDPDPEISVPVESDGMENDERWSDDETSDEFLK